MKSASSVAAIKLRAVGDSLAKDAPQVVSQAALVMKQSLVAQLNRDSGGDGRLSRWRSGKGVRVSAGYDVMGKNNPVALLKPRGPVGVLEKGSSPHSIPKNLRRSKRLRLPSGGIRTKVNHPGHAGKRSWTKGKERGTPLAIRVLQRRFTTIAKDAFLR